ncbi:hypothetical protein I6E54_08365 [Bacteroides caecigallinarum]|nr:hypothetical protein [uncultured Bacteroides sp.]MCF2737728.1 hypothetical protein [Bacteroides caecigallinarum]MDN0072004.1 hypothetical protein [Bacteroides caecigallinarum]
MKKLLFFACLTFALASCEKDPDMSELDTDLTVYTDYDSSADFGTSLGSGSFCFISFKPSICGKTDIAAFAY